MKKKSNKKKKYTVGGKVNTYVQDPATMLAENQIMIAQAQLEASTNPFLQGMNALSGLMGMAGSQLMSMGGKGGSSTSGFSSSLEVGDVANDIVDVDTGGVFQAKLGGRVPVEVEGGEVAETPDGQLLNFQGASHAQGGIDVDLPPMTEIFSKELKIEGKTLAQRKLDREKKEKKFSKETDGIGKNTLGRIKHGNTVKETLDKTVQSIAQMLEAQENLNNTRKKYALGTPEGGVEKEDEYGVYYNVDGVSKKALQGAELKALQDKLYKTTEIGYFPHMRDKKIKNVHKYPGASVPFTVDDVYVGNPDLEHLLEADKVTAENPLGIGDAYRTSFYKRGDESLEEIKKLIVEDKMDHIIRESIYKPSPPSAQLHTPGTVDMKMKSAPQIEAERVARERQSISENNAFSNLKTNPNKEGRNLGLTAGDVLGMAGNAYQSISGYQDALRSRATSSPNINPYVGFGEDALRANQDAMGFSQSVLDNQLQDIELSTTGARSNLRGSARGVNTMRALDVATEGNKQKAVRGAYDAYANQMLNIYSQKSQLENQQDETVMRGKGMQDLADRQDHGAYLSNVAQAKMNIGQGITGFGKFLNQSKERDIMETLLGSMFTHTGFDMNTGQLTGKDNAQSLVDNDAWMYATDNPNTSDGKYNSLEEFMIVKGLVKQPKKKGAVQSRTNTKYKTKKKKK